MFALVLFLRSFYEFWKWLPTEFWTWLTYKSGGWDSLIEGVKLNLQVYLLTYSVDEPLRFWTGILLEPFLGLVLGLVAWRMITIGRCIRRLNGNFDLVPQPGHPDGCGGLEPLGHLSLLNALIISIWGVFLGGWIILGPSTKYGDFYTSLYLSLVPVPVFMAVLCFALPLWGVHDTMSAQMEIFRRGIDRLGHQVDRLSRELVEGAALLEPDEMGRMKGRLEIMDEVYKKNQTFPVWPFNNNILIRFLTSQAVPLLGLTGLGKPIVDMISILADFLGQL